MIGNVITPFEGYNPPFDPDSVFDPTTHIATESNFIKLLENGVYDSKYIGYKVQLSNSIDYNNGLWVIADVNHDSTNTGQTNCYDLISENCLSDQKSSPTGYYGYRNCDLRSWLISTFYNGFSSDFKSHMMNIKYNSNGTWYNDDKIITPSCVELNYNYNGEGAAYPIFSDNNSRIKLRFGTSSTARWCTRTWLIDSYNHGWYVNNDGSVYYETYINAYVVPILRVS